jgi:hypothetical protein
MPDSEIKTKNEKNCTIIHQAHQENSTKIPKALY